MKHLGDITKINGSEIEPVDVITGGSPCQDLSVAGKRAGLDGERSGLFMEQVRIVKEMRETDEQRGRTGHFIRPRFMVWENVLGAFSSNKGKDFQAVLTEIVRIVEPNCPDVPFVEGGRWSKSGCIYDEMGKWSVAWRVHDAQFWGVPQRRQRIALVADFGGLAAPEVLFERKGLSGNFEQGGTQGEGTPRGTESGVGTTSKCLNSWDIQSKHIQPESGTAEALYSGECRYGGGESYVMQSSAISFQERAGKSGGGKGILIQKDKIGALSTLNNQNVLACAWDGTQISSTLTAHNANGSQRMPDKDNFNAVIQSTDVTPLVYDAYQHHGHVRGDTPLCIGNGQVNDATTPSKVSKTLNTLADPMKVMANAAVRRLTPLECERLQGFPDGWTDIGEWTDSKGKKHDCSDSARYKALGNSIALPFWKVLAKRISAQYDRDITLGSLFDGIGGFPLVFEQINGKGTARWASEIEEFPIAVTKKRFGEE